VSLSRHFAANRHQNAGSRLGYESSVPGISIKWSENVKAHLRPASFAFTLIFTGILAGQTTAPADKIVVPEGTDVKMKTLEPLSSKTARVGDPVALEVTDDVRVSGRLIVPRGSKGHGEVTLVKKHGMAGKAGDLIIRPNYVRIGDFKLELRGAKETEGVSKHGQAIALATISGVGILKRGQNAVVPVGTQVIGIVMEDTPVPLPAAPPRTQIPSTPIPEPAN